MITCRFMPSMAKRTALLGAGAISLLLGLVAAWAADAPSPGIPTTVMVRVVGNRAMVLGDAVGGAAVTIKDLATGAVLASGVQTGSGGDLRSIMMTPRQQHEQIYSLKGAASFTATLSLTKPTLLEITGEGPLKLPRATRRASKTVLL